MAFFKGNGGKHTSAYKNILTHEAKQYAKRNAGFKFEDTVPHVKRVGRLNHAILENAD